MRFKVKEEVEPKIGTKEEITRFAFFPVKIGDIKIWLEKYISTDEIVKEIAAINEKNVKIIDDLSIDKFNFQNKIECLNKEIDELKFELDKKFSLVNYFKNLFK